MSLTMGRLRELARQHGRRLVLLCACGQYSSTPGDYWQMRDWEDFGACDECGTDIRAALRVPARFEVVD